MAVEQSTTWVDDAAQWIARLKPRLAPRPKHDAALEELRRVVTQQAKRITQLEAAVGDLEAALSQIHPDYVS